MYQPKTGQKCSCRKGQQRDNCPNCEGTGMVIDFAAIRAKISKPTPKINDKFRFDDGTIGTIIATELRIGKVISDSIVVESEKLGRCSFQKRYIIEMQMFILSYRNNCASVEAQQKDQRLRGTALFVSHLPGDGGAGWGFVPDRAQAIAQTAEHAAIFMHEYRHDLPQSTIVNVWTVKG